MTKKTEKKRNKQTDEELQIELNISWISQTLKMVAATFSQASVTIYLSMDEI